MVARDAGGLLMGSSLNALEPDRVVTVALVNYTLDTGERVDATNVEDSPLIADATPAPCVDAAPDAPGRGAARRASARSTSSTDSSRGAPTERNKLAKSFARPRTRWLLRINARETSRFPKRGGGRRSALQTSSPGPPVSAKTITAFATNLIHRKRRVYVSRVHARGGTSYGFHRVAATPVSPSAAGRPPGRLFRGHHPSRRAESSGFDSSRLPLTHDVNVTFPLFTAVARDVSGNAIQSFPTSAACLSSRPAVRLVGDVVPIIDGVASFTEFAIIGRRGVPYVLTLRLANASIDASRAVTLSAPLPTERLSTASGACASSGIHRGCLPRERYRTRPARRVVLIFSIALRRRRSDHHRRLCAGRYVRGRCSLRRWVLQTRPRRVSVRAMSSEHGHAHRSRPSSRGGSNHPERCVTSRVPRKRQRVGVSMRRRRRRAFVLRSRRRRGDVRAVSIRRDVRFRKRHHHLSRSRSLAREREFVTHRLVSITGRVRRWRRRRRRGVRARPSRSRGSCAPGTPSSRNLSRGRVFTVYEVLVCTRKSFRDGFDTCREDDGDGGRRLRERHVVADGRRPRQDDDDAFPNPRHARDDRSRSPARNRWIV